ncbi:MarR family transcriptional regulator [Actinomadura atramentaria]|uniref:MarR family transcriptional regulator n=1 Tax=Actinomadura atramentaria TaxID=1990 RepID=UPI0003733143|nr:MarR family transcriptional regulator [Actinomadura atramentaria]
MTASGDLHTELRRAAMLAVQLQQAVAARAGLTVTDAQCAVLLDLDGPKTPGELARAVGVSTGGAITTVIDRLEDAGLARRTPDPGDRRRVRVEPVPGALARLAGFAAPAHRAVAAATPPDLAAALLGWARDLNAALPAAIDEIRAGRGDA